MVNCPKCGTKLPFIRWPDSPKQAAWGGWTCPNPKCKCKIDRKGREIKSKK